MMLIWQCSSCKWGFSGEWQKKCPACGIDDYWTGSVHPDAKDWYETGYKPPPQAAPDARALADEATYYNDREMEAMNEQDWTEARHCAGHVWNALKRLQAALLPTAPPAETAELGALKEAARIYEEHSGSLDPEYESTPLETAAVAWARAEREAAGGGKP